MFVFYDVVAYCETFRASVKISFFILSYRGPGGGRPWPNPTNANSVSICIFTFSLHFVAFNNKNLLLLKALQLVILTFF